MMSIGLHLRLSGHPARAHALHKFIAYAKSFPGVWFARRIDIANHWIEHHQDTLLPRVTYPRITA
jgi:allantoinase